MRRASTGRPRLQHPCPSPAGVRLAPTIVELNDEDVFGDNTGKARRDAISNFENIWTNWMQLTATIDWAIQDSVRDLPLWKSVDAENVTKNTRGVPQYRAPRASPAATVYELIVNSPSCRLQHGGLPYVALAFLGRHCRAAGLERRVEGCHSTGQLVMNVG